MMECTGRIQNIATDWQTGKFNVTFSLNENSSINEIAKLKECEKVAIKMTKHRNRRSLDSNAYAWVLMQKIAEAINSDRWSVYLDMLQKYSREFTFVICKENAIDKLKELYRTTIDLGEVNVNGTEGHQMQVFFGSSTFDSKAMSVFIDGIVSECKELGIETLPPDMLARMNAEWGQKA
jgi:hypothetical protein